MLGQEPGAHKHFGLHALCMHGMARGATHARSAKWVVLNDTGGVLKNTVKGRDGRWVHPRVLCWEEPCAVHAAPLTSNMGDCVAAPPLSNTASHPSSAMTKLGCGCHSAGGSCESEQLRAGLAVRLAANK
jgi:hypothetical protein